MLAVGCGKRAVGTFQHINSAFERFCGDGVSFLFVEGSIDNEEFVADRMFFARNIRRKGIFEEAFEIVEI